MDTKTEQQLIQQQNDIIRRLVRMETRLLTLADALHVNVKEVSTAEFVRMYNEGKR